MRTGHSGKPFAEWPRTGRDVGWGLAWRCLRECDPVQAGPDRLPRGSSSWGPGGWGWLGCAQGSWRQLPGRGVPWNQPSLRAAVPYGHGPGCRGPEAELGAPDFLWGPRACRPACLVPAGTVGCGRTAGPLAVGGRLTVPVSPWG